MNSNKSRGSLIDHGANGGVVGSDVRVISWSERCVDITGIDDHELTGIPIGTAGAVVQSQHGPLIAILNQYALHGTKNQEIRTAKYIYTLNIKGKQHKAS